MMELSCFVISLGELHEQVDQLVMIPEIGFISNEGNLLTDRYKNHAGTSLVDGVPDQERLLDT